MNLTLDWPVPGSATRGSRVACVPLYINNKRTSLLIVVGLVGRNAICLQVHKALQPSRQTATYSLRSEPHRPCTCVLTNPADAQTRVVLRT
jgi:hypothetical protein